MFKIHPPQGLVATLLAQQIQAVANPFVLNAANNFQIIGTDGTTIFLGVAGHPTIAYDNLNTTKGLTFGTNYSLGSGNVDLHSDSGTTVYLSNVNASGGSINIRPAFGTGNPYNMQLIISASGTYSTDSSGNPRNYLDDGTGNAVVVGTLRCKTNATGSGSAALGANCPATTVSAPYTWIKMISSDGSTVYVPAWK
jgi:hypothetical protein